MTNNEILDTAIVSSAIDLGCDKSDFLKHEDVIVISKPNSNSKKYLNLPFFCNLTSYGNNIVASVHPEILEFIKKYLNNSQKGYWPFDRFEPPFIFALNKELNKYDYEIRHMLEYFLPDVDLLKPKNVNYDLKILKPKDFVNLYKPEWNNALQEKRPDLDTLGIGAYDGEELIGLGGLSADCEAMWQIGVDVLPEYRRKGIASAITTNLATQALALDKVPFYCSSWSNIKSVRNAIKSAFYPAWIQLIAEKRELK